MSPELRAALEGNRFVMEKLDVWPGDKSDYAIRIGAIDTILRYAECNPTIPDRALCQCWGDVIKAAISAALWDRVSKEG